MMHRFLHNHVKHHTVSLRESPGHYIQRRILACFKIKITSRRSNNVLGKWRTAVALHVVLYESSLLFSLVKN